jgi:enoyl-[acyl-carrier protein] reductase / trans-2-enoyl-CoA reductase (NAD+)
MEPKVRRNIFLNCNPEGLKSLMHQQLRDLKSSPRFEAPKHALIIGGSSGYGFASRLVLAEQGTKTVSVSFEKAPEDEKTGSAGYWNNTYFMEHFKDGHLDLNQDAFSKETKQDVIKYYQSLGVKIDVIIYSLASGVRPGPNGELVRSALKPLGKAYTGLHLDVASNSLSEMTLEPATEEETKDTVYVMGGSDFYDWVMACDEAGILSDQVKAMTYSYVGGTFTKPIYRDGTLGKAKDDLEAYTYKLDAHLKRKGGEAIVARLKAIVTKASMFIPGIAAYGGILFDEMIKRGVHESTLEHVKRLFRDTVYGKQRIFDEEGRLCLDTLELEPSLQETVNERLLHADESILSLKGMKIFIDEFYEINGFR